MGLRDASASKNFTSISGHFLILYLAHALDPFASFEPLFKIWGGSPSWILDQTLQPIFFNLDSRIQISLYLEKTFTFHDQGRLNFPPKLETNMVHDSSGDVWIRVRIWKRLRNGFWIGTMLWTICFEIFMTIQPEKNSSNCNLKKWSCSSPSATR